MNTDFIKGSVYFRVAYLDRDLFYPEIESFVFVGKNLSDEDKEDTWYFQFATSYAKGKTRKLELDERLYVLATREQLGVILTAEQLYAELKEVASRRDNS
jgi:hypothetical protein